MITAVSSLTGPGLAGGASLATASAIVVGLCVAVLVLKEAVVASRMSFAIKLRFAANVVIPPLLIAALMVVSEQLASAF